MERFIISKELKVLFFGFIICAFLLAVRIKMTQSFFFLFLAWNLFLAFIPYGITFIIKAYPRLKERWWTFIPLAGLWLLFLPNTPYILSDLQHLRHTPAVLLWLDVILLATFVWYALFIMFLTVRDMQELWAVRLNKIQISAFTLCVFILCGLGIYLGRELRWNSWDIVQNPMAIAGDIWYRVRHPFRNAQTWLVTFGYAGILSLVFYSFSFGGSNTQPVDEK